MANRRVTKRQSGGKRPDGTNKGVGFFGTLKAPDGKDVTEYSIGVGFDGKDMLIPTVVPGLTEEQLRLILSGGNPDKQVIDKAIKHALNRLSSGKSPYLEAGFHPNNNKKLIRASGSYPSSLNPLY